MEGTCLCLQKIQMPAQLRSIIFFQRGALQGRIGIESLGRLGKKFLPPLQVQMAKLRLHLSKTAPTSSFLLF